MSFGSVGYFKSWTAPVYCIDNKETSLPTNPFAGPSLMPQRVHRHVLIVPKALMILGEMALLERVVSSRKGKEVHLPALLSYSLFL